MVYIVDVPVYPIWRSAIEGITWNGVAIPTSFAVSIAIITIHGVINIASASITAVVTTIDIAVAVVVVIPS